MKLPEEAKEIENFLKFQTWMKKTNIFKCKPPEVHFTIRNRVPYNKHLTNRACAGGTGEYWPSVVSVRTSLHSVRTATTSGQYSSVRPSHSVNKRLLLLLFSEVLCKRNLAQLFFLPLVNYILCKRVLLCGPYNILHWSVSNLLSF